MSDERTDVYAKLSGDSLECPELASVRILLDSRKLRLRNAEPFTKFSLGKACRLTGIAYPLSRKTSKRIVCLNELLASSCSRAKGLESELRLHQFLEIVHGDEDMRVFAAVDERRIVKLCGGYSPAVALVPRSLTHSCTTMSPWG